MTETTIEGPGVTFVTAAVKRVQPAIACRCGKTDCVRIRNQKVLEDDITDGSA